ncbi:ABC transporter permease [Nesterenkonia alkaliphila]|nr:ABC transporter permease [Nesterenkonia alkaliphila]
MTKELTQLHARELVRDARYFWFALFFPFFMLGTFLGVGALMPDEPGTPDFTETVIPLAIFLAVTSTALTVTAGPLAGMRSSGLLRLLSTTPVGRRQLVLTHLTTRVVMVVVQLALLMVIAVAIGSVELSSLPLLFGITLLGMAMFLGIGYILGGLLSSPDMATHIGTFIQLGTLFLSGLAIPLWLLPEGLANVLELLPTTFFADLLATQVTGAEPIHPAWLSAVVVAASAVVAIAVAMVSFRWDQGGESA